MPSIAAWPTSDAVSLGRFFHDDAVYHNMPLEAAVGREAIVASFASFMAMGGEVGVEIVHLVADGPIVMTERIDHFNRADGTTISLPVVGVCEVHDGRISAWRDYFDLSEFSAAMSR